MVIHKKKRVYNICKKHLVENITVIGDIDTSLTFAAKEMKLHRITYKNNTYEAYEVLAPVNQLCARFKFFIDNEQKKENDLYKITL